MTSISTSLASYYQLFGQSSGGASSSLTGNSSAVTTLAQALAAVDSSSSNGSSASSSAYSLSLSPAAQTLLSGGSSSSTNSSSSSSTFTLTSAQQTTISNILKQYKNAPFTQATFDEIQNALSAAGVSPAQLSAKDEIQSFNPTNVFLSALSGNTPNINTPSNTLSSEQTKANNYMQSIIKAWQSISTTASSSDSSSSSSSSSSTS